MTDLRYWKIAPGENGFLWDECRSKKCILIGWPALGDYSSYPDKSALQAALIQSGASPTKAKIIWPFAHEI